MSESRGAIASKVCAAMMLAGGFLVLAAAFPVHADTGSTIPGAGPVVLVLLMAVALATMAGIVAAVLRPNLARAKRPRR